MIIGARYLNVTGMLPFENMIADNVKETNNHVLYRVAQNKDYDTQDAGGGNAPAPQESMDQPEPVPAGTDYILNTNTHRLLNLSANKPPVLLF